MSFVHRDIELCDTINLTAISDIEYPFFRKIRAAFCCSVFFFTIQLYQEENRLTAALSISLNSRLLLRLLEHHVLAELLAVLRKLDLALDFLLVLAAPIHLAGGLVLELDQSFL